jgi:DHA1 family tetracycline resistance protein-like MFS transporter
MTKTPIYLVLLTVFIDLLGFGIIIPLLPFYAQHFGAGPTVIGLLGSSYSLMQFLFVPFWGRLSDKIGRRPIILMSVFGSFLSYLIFGLAGSLFTLFLSRVLAGFMGANISTAQAYIADVTPVEDRAKYMGLIGASFGIGFMLGPFVGGIMSHISYGAPGYLASCLSLINATLAYFYLPESRTKTASLASENLDPARRARILDIDAIRIAFKKPALPNLILVYFLYTISFSTLYVSFPLYTKEILKYDAAANGYLFALMGLIGVFIQGGLIGKIINVLGERNTMVIGIILLILGLSFIPDTRSPAVLVVLIIVMSTGSSILTPSLTSLITKYAGATEYGSALGVSQSFSSLGRVIGPSLGGAILGTAGLIWPFYSSSILLVAAVVLARKIPNLYNAKATEFATSK